MENFISVVNELERLWEAIDVNKTDIDRMDDIADVLGYSGRVVLAFDIMPDESIVPNDYFELLSEGDQVLVKYGSDKGIYQLFQEENGDGTLVYRLDHSTQQPINEVDVVVLKLVDGENIVYHSVLFYSKGKWHERLISEYGHNSVES